jgi:hypothetical protein
VGNRADRPFAVLEFAAVTKAARNLRRCGKALQAEHLLAAERLMATWRTAGLLDR